MPHPILSFTICLLINTLLNWDDRKTSSLSTHVQDCSLRKCKVCHVQTPSTFKHIPELLSKARPSSQPASRKVSGAVTPVHQLQRSLFSYGPASSLWVFILKVQALSYRTTRMSLALDMEFACPWHWRANHSYPGTAVFDAVPLPFTKQTSEGMLQPHRRAGYRPAQLPRTNLAG